MKQYENFKKKGKYYVLEPQKGTAIVLVILLLLAGVALLVWGSGHVGGYLLIGIAVLAGYSQSKRKLLIDTDNRVFIVRNNGFQPEVIYPFTAYQDVAMHKVKYFGLITLNVSAVLYFIQDGQERKVGMHQALITRPVQHLIDEFNEILQECGIILK